MWRAVMKKANIVNIICADTHKICVHWRRDLCLHPFRFLLPPWTCPVHNFAFYFLSKITAKTHFPLVSQRYKNILAGSVRTVCYFYFNVLTMTCLNVYTDRMVWSHHHPETRTSRSEIYSFPVRPASDIWRDSVLI